MVLFFLIFSEFSGNFETFCNGLTLLMNRDLKPSVFGGI